MKIAIAVLNGVTDVSNEKHCDRSILGNCIVLNDWQFVRTTPGVKLGWLREWDIKKRKASWNWNTYGARSCEEV